MAANKVGVFSNSINGGQIQKDAYNSHRNLMVDSFLLSLIYLEPLNLFLYTWRFLSELDQSVSKPAAKTFLKWFARINMLLIPPALISIVTAFIVEYARYEYYSVRFKLEEANHYFNISQTLFKTIEILGPVTNLISCLILAMVIRLVVRMSRQVQAGMGVVAAKNKINTLVTASHIGVTLAFTFTQTILIFRKNVTQDYRMDSAFYFFGGLADIFLSLMLWFILDSQKQATVFLDGNRVYSVADVIKLQHSVNSEDCKD